MAQYAIGIDLGTTHCELSFYDLAGGSRNWRESMLPIRQLTAPGTIEQKTLLPSFLYLPAPGEFPPESLALNSERANSDIVGEFARSHGAKAPSRLVASAKVGSATPALTA
jgi:molecular chaperone DnaK (HSP70)